MSVYFVTAREAGAVKIGHSVDPHARLRELQTSCPHRLKLEAVMAGEFAEEGDLHWRFAEARLQGEWFAITPDIEALIVANPAGPKPKGPHISRAKAARPPIIFGETAREYERRLQNEKLAVLREAGKLWLERKAASGDIYFPFRAEREAA